MPKVLHQALLLATFLMPAGRAPQALSRLSGAAQPQLKMVVILSRHGVRSPTWTQTKLDSYSALPWPKWNVPAANLTARGHQLLTRFGNYDRAELAAQGLLAAKGCGEAAAAYFYADTDQRTIESAQALAEGLFPDCAIPLHGLPEGAGDPLFHPAANGVAPAEADEAFTQLSAELKHLDHAGQSAQQALIAEMQQVLRGCAPKAACAPEHAPQNLLPAGPNEALRGKGDHIIDLAGPLPLGSTFAEDFLLEYADGKPMKEVGWGNLDQAQIARFMELHTRYFKLVHRTRAVAQAEASNLLFHIERTLEQAATAKPVAGAVGRQGTKLVVLMGHDTNLAAISQLLGVHWTLDGRTDDTPPGTEMAFELWQDSRGTYTVRVTLALQTLQQLRDLPDATPAEHTALTLPACSTAHATCTWSEFQQLVQLAVRSSDVYPITAR